jgi:hypothetical protein
VYIVWCVVSMWCVQHTHVWEGLRVTSEEDPGSVEQWTSAILGSQSKIIQDSRHKFKYDQKNHKKFHILKSWQIP